MADPPQGPQHHQHIGCAILGFLDPEHGAIESPELWRTQLLQEWLDGKSRLALSKTCRAGRDWVFSTAKDMQLTLRCTDDQQQQQRMLAGARQPLQRRGQQPSSLTIDQGDASMASLGQLPPQLQGAAYSVHGLTLRLTQQEDGAQYQACLTAFVAEVGSTITTLEISPLRRPLPLKDTLPRLQHLKVNLDPAEDTARAVFDSMAAYLPQLTSFAQTGDYDLPGRLWPLLLNRASHSPTLKRFSITGPLTGTLVRLLVQHAPALEDVTAFYMPASVSCSYLTWRVRRLHLGVAACGLPRVGANCSDLAGLPRSEQLAVTVQDSQCVLQFAIDSVQGLPARVRERLPRWHITRVHVVGLWLDPADQRTALAACLQQIATMRGEHSIEVMFQQNSTIDNCIKHWKWAEQLVASSAALARLKLQRWEG